MIKMTKICNNCGKRLEDSVNFCPDCKSQSFKTLNEITPASDSSIVHRLFYWNCDGYYVISKSKIIGIATFIILFLASPINASGFFVAMIIALLVFLVCYALHRAFPMHNKVKIRYNNYGLIEDMKHLFFYWQNNKGGYAISKTKIITFIFFILVIGLVASFNFTTIGVAILVGAMVAAPIYAVGFAVHKLTNPNPEAKPQVAVKKQKKIRKPKVTKKVETPEILDIPEFAKYKNQINDLKSEFDTKSQSTRDLIEKRFEPPQLTYTRFISVVDKASELFDSQASSALSIINLASEFSPRVEKEILTKIDVLKSIISKLDDLQNELVITVDKSDDNDVSDLFDDMQTLIDSVKEYD